MRPLRVAASILSADFARLDQEIARVPDTDWIHVDVMDGQFVPNITLGTPIVASLRRCTSLPLDVHLMITAPERFIPMFAEAGADCLTVHAEATAHLHRAVQAIKNHGCRAGVALNPSTPLEAVRYVLQDVDLVLLMTVNPGFGGQAFIPNVLPKIAELRDLLARHDLTPDVQVDGGINRQTARAVVEQGANVLVAGAAVFGAPDPNAAVLDLRSSVQDILT